MYDKWILYYYNEWVGDRKEFWRKPTSMFILFKMLWYLFLNEALTPSIVPLNFKFLYLTSVYIDNCTNMSFNKFTPITKLTPSRIKWNIRVKTQAVWKGITRETKEFRGINMILVDDSVSSITEHYIYISKYVYMFHDKLKTVYLPEIPHPCFR